MKITLSELRQIVKSIIKEEMTAGNPKLTPDQIISNLFNALKMPLGQYVKVTASGNNKILLQSGGQNIITIEVGSDGGGRLYLGDLYKNRGDVINFWKAQNSMDKAVKSYTNTDVYNIRVENPELIKDTLMNFFEKYGTNPQIATAKVPNYQTK